MTVEMTFWGWGEARERGGRAGKQVVCLIWRGKGGATET